jgi:proteasome lid subunit RPN8/RPN11
VPITIMLEDHTGNISRQARMDEKANVAQLIPAIITALKLPITDNAGRAMTYHLSHSGRRLQENETLATAAVEGGDTLTIVPEMTAGAFSEHFFSVDPPLVELDTTIRRTKPIHGFPSAWYRVQAMTSAIQVTLKPSVWKCIWEQTRTTTSQEVGGILVGNIYQEKKQFLVYVTKALPAEHTKAGRAFVTFTNQTWLSILEQVNRLPSQVVLGWYHSHPGIGIFLSSSDEFIHRSYFGDQPWYLALVVDPISAEWGVFSWEQGKIRKCSPC